MPLDIVVDNTVTLPLVSNIYNPFKESFDRSALNFDVKSADIYIPDTDVECEDKKAICKLDNDGNVIDWWVVGRDYYVKSHKEFFGSIENQIIERIDPSHITGVDITTKTSRNGRWGFRQYMFPNVRIPVETTNKFKTDIKMRIVAWSGLDGGTANNYMLGAIDGFCMNGCVWSSLGKDGYVKKYRRNTKGFNLESFSFEIGDAVDMFYEMSTEFQAMAQQPLSLQSGIDFIESIKTFSKSKTEAMKELYTREVVTRGNNVFALHSAFTNYSSHRNDDLFRTRKTKREDVQAELMFKREEEVTNIIESKQWADLVAA